MFTIVWEYHGAEDRSVWPSDVLTMLRTLMIVDADG